MLAMANVQPGMRVLDLACGAGSQTLQAAKSVGPAGSVVACDISASMLEYVRRNAASAGLQNVELLECAAEHLDAGLAPFDASISRLGLMLFPSPASALAAVQRVLKPGAHFAALVFTAAQNNRFLAEPMAILLRHAGKPAPAPGQPGIFALGGKGVLEKLLRDSGLKNVKTVTLRTSFRMPSASDTLQMMQEAFGAYRAVVADLREQEKSDAWAEVYDCIKGFEKHNGIETEFEVAIGSGSTSL
jgi:ubiquinone/menaquinone biosynthesis C-methylase UbiE